MGSIVGAATGHAGTGAWVGAAAGGVLGAAQVLGDEALAERVKFIHEKTGSDAIAEQFIAGAIQSAREKRLEAEVIQVRAEDGGGFERPCGDARVGEGVATNHDRR